MIQKIDINNFGLFEDFVWNSVLGGDARFKKVNIIYGRNYSGKTTLSRIFRCVENGKIHEKYPNSDFSISLDSENLTQITQNNLDTVPNDIKVRVYNTDFVKANLSWLHRDDGSIESFALLGAENVELEKKIEEIKEKLGTEGDRNGLRFELEQKTIAYGQAHSVVNAKEDKLKKQLSEEAGRIKTNTKLYDSPNYIITSIRKDILQATESYILSDEEIDERKNLLKEEPKKNLPKMLENKLKFFKFQYLNELLEKEIKPDQPITDLINDSLLQYWVLEGIDIHKNRTNSCGFCGNPISEDLWDKLDAHFSEESKTLKLEISYQITELEEGMNTIHNYVMPVKGDFYACFHAEYGNLLELWQEIKDTYSNSFNSFLKKLQEREKDIFKIQTAIECDDLSERMLAFCVEVNKVIENHNNKTYTLTSDQEKAQDELRLSRVAKFLKDIDYQDRNNEIEALKKEVADLENDKNQIQQAITALEKEEETLEAQKKDKRKGAELVNGYLTRFFGHDALMLEPQGTGQFKVMRNGVEATNLSEGECSLIAFCYFIAKINDELKDEQNDTKLIIYIDDPISSLDSNHVFFVFSLIDHVIARPRKYKQLFISTHNLDFLKYLKRITVPNESRESRKKDLAHFLIQREQKQNLNRSKLVKMPTHIERYSTEFNYLFEQIYDVRKREMGEKRGKGDGRMMLNNTYTQFYNLPNNLRKFLECYLFFKYPNNEDPLDNLDKFFENDASFINRVVNEHSHLTHLDRGWRLMDIDEIETCAKLVLDKIEEKDKEQFDALVESVS